MDAPGVESSSRMTRLDDEAAGSQGEASKSTATSPAITPLDSLLMPARTLLREWTLGRYLATKEAVSGPPLLLTSDTSVGEALELLSGSGCLSAPVLDCDQGHIDSATNWLGACASKPHSPPASETNRNHARVIRRIPPPHCPMQASWMSQTLCAACCESCTRGCWMSTAGARRAA
jgi:hypothetical protein